MIVASILLAFGIDTWWAGLREAEVRRTAVHGLIEDFNRNLEGIDETIDGHVRVIRMMHAYDTRPEEVLALPPDSLTEWVGFGMAWWGTFDAQTGTLDGLIASGSFDLIDSVDLRTSLVEWQARLVDNQEEGAEVMTHTQRILSRLATLGGPWTGIDLAGERSDWGDEFSLFPALNLERLIADPELTGMLRHRHMLSLAYLRELLPLREQTEGVLEALASELR